ncbi:MAG: GNAT family N-acetyltransferase [Marinicella sp.]|nr:GNAT family N-acetyltransferase [Xanthomonadales bacterium]
MSIGTGTAPLLTMSLVSLSNINTKHQQFYQQLYQNPQVMQHIGSPLTDAAAERSFKLLLSRSRLSAELITQMIIFKSRVIGLTQAKLKDNCWFLGIMLLPEYHGQGLAGIAHEKMITQLEQSIAYLKNRHIMVAECRANNRAANRLYCHLGFKLTDTKTENNKTTNRWEKI